MQKVHEPINEMKSETYNRLRPDVEKAARHSDLANPDTYDVSNTTHFEGGSMPALALVMIFIAFLLMVFLLVAVSVGHSPI